MAIPWKEQTHSFYSRLFFFNDTATTEIYTLSLHDALPISRASGYRSPSSSSFAAASTKPPKRRSEEHTSELQSRRDLVCRLLLEKKKKCTNDSARSWNSPLTFGHT